MMVPFLADSINRNRKGRPCGIGLSEEGDGANFTGSPRSVAAISASGSSGPVVIRRSYYIETPKTPKSYDNSPEFLKILRKTAVSHKKARRLRSFYTKFYNRYSHYNPYSPIMSLPLLLTYSEEFLPNNRPSHNQKQSSVTSLLTARPNRLAVLKLKCTIQIILYSAWRRMFWQTSNYSV